MITISSNFYNIPHEVLDLIEAAHQEREIFYEGSPCLVEITPLPSLKEMEKLSVVNPCHCMGYELLKDKITAKKKNQFFAKKHVATLILAQYLLDLNLQNGQSIPLKIEIKSKSYVDYYHDQYENMSKKAQKQWIKAHVDRSKNYLMFV